MVDVKVCSQCGSSIPAQAIIDGQAKLVNGQLICGQCSGGAPAKAPAQPAPQAAAAKPAQAAPKPADDDGLIKVEGLEAPAAPSPQPAAQTPPEPRAEVPLSLDAGGEGHEQITIFGGEATMAGAEEEVAYKREPTVSGQGAVRVKTFDTKLSRAAFTILDQQINEWLDESGYEVKQVTANIGEIHGKTTTEPHLIINVWY